MGLDAWVNRFARNEDGVRVAVLDAEIRPRAVGVAFLRERVNALTASD